MPAPYKEYKSWSFPALLLQVELIRSQQGWARQAAGGEGGWERGRTVGLPRAAGQTPDPLKPWGNCRASWPSLCSASRAWKRGCFRERATGCSLRYPVGCWPPPAFGHGPVSCPPRPTRSPWPRPLPPLPQQYSRARAQFRQLLGPAPAPATRKLGGFVQNEPLGLILPVAQRGSCLGAFSKAPQLCQIR